MVSNADGRITLTAAEAEVMAMLRGGPALTGAKTEVVFHRAVDDRPRYSVRLVERRVARALERRGLAAIAAKSP